jgi:hypothetical protein
MPNYYYNTLTVSHTDSKMMDKFKEATESGGVMNYFIPCPQDRYVKDGLNGEKCIPCGWGNDNWGTKWDFGTPNDDMDVDIDEEDNTITIHFSTPWNAPWYFLEHLLNLGYTLKHTGNEETEECECKECTSKREHLEAEEGNDCECETCQDGFVECDCEECPGKQDSDIRYRASIMRGFYDEMIQKIEAEEEDEEVDHDSCAGSDCECGCQDCKGIENGCECQECQCNSDYDEDEEDEDEEEVEEVKMFGGVPTNLLPPAMRCFTQ